MLLEDGDGMIGLPERHLAGVDICHELLCYLPRARRGDAGGGRPHEQLPPALKVSVIRLRGVVRAELKEINVGFCGRWV